MCLFISLAFSVEGGEKERKKEKNNEENVSSTKRKRSFLFISINYSIEIWTLFDAKTTMLSMCEMVDHHLNDDLCSFH